MYLVIYSEIWWLFWNFWDNFWIGWYYILFVWIKTSPRIVPHCLMWCIWREQNSRSFEDRERSILEFKSFFFSTLLEWCLVLPSFSCISLSGLLEHCTLISWCFCLFSTFPMYRAVFFQYTFKLLIKKKKRYTQLHLPKSESNFLR